MLDSLKISNYRSLKELKIKALGKVNLITGKNNTGKSTILEAVALYASNGDLKVIHHLLKDRGEDVVKADNSTEKNIKTLSPLFHNRIIGFEKENTISIGPLDNSSGQETAIEKSISLRFVKYFDEIKRDDNGNITGRNRLAVDSSNQTQYPDFKLGFQAGVNTYSYTLSLEEFSFPQLKPPILDLYSNRIFQLIRTRSIDRGINGELFDLITLTEKEQDVIDALKIIEPNAERIAFIQDDRGRTPVIKLANSQSILPLKSMGDGINRILTIILALVNCDGGYLLIDEFENGLHYSVQQQLWEIIFSLSQKLNIQVFATTHSEDCIVAFGKVLNSPNNTLDGKLIRLDNINGVIKQVEYSASELKIATNQNIETR